MLSASALLLVITFTLNVIDLCRASSHCSDCCRRCDDGLVLIVVVAVQIVTAGIMIDLLLTAVVAIIHFILVLMVSFYFHSSHCHCYYESEKSEQHILSF